MTFTEVVVASVVLTLSTHLGLQSWTSTVSAADRHARQRDLALQLDQQVLASQRLLAAGAGSASLLQGSSCRLDSVVIEQLLDRSLPSLTGFDRSLVTAADLEGVWLVWRGEGMTAQQPWQRRILFTPAGLGLCENR